MIIEAIILNHRCEAMDKLVQIVLQDEDLDGDVLTNLAICLCQLLQEQIEGKVFPETVSPELVFVSYYYHYV